MRAQQSTVARRVTCRGIGLHGGNAVEIALCPAEPGTGIVFLVDPESVGSEVAGPEGESEQLRAPHGDHRRRFEIPARATAVLSSSRATSLTDGFGTTLSTVEHLLAVLYVLRLDNVRVEVRGSEIPMMDGSALPFLDWVHSAGRALQLTPRVEFDVARPFEIREGDRWIRIEPYAGLRISYAIDFDHPSIGRQSLELEYLDEESFAGEIAAARTFGFEHEIESLRSAGLAIGGSFENAVVLGVEGVLNDSGLRWPDEFVRHKVIDLLGDLSLLGARLNGHVHVERGGHGLHHKLVQGLLDEDGLLLPVTDRETLEPLSRSRRVQSLA